MYTQTKEATPLAATPSAVAQTASASTSALPAIGWVPCSWNNEVQGCIFLPRMLAKGRRLLDGWQQGRDLMNGFLFGDFDYADRGILKLLRTNEARVLAHLRAADNQAAAEAIIRESGRSTAELQAWSRRFRRINFLFTAMWDADEGRRSPGLGTSLLSWSYNTLLMPPVYVGFRLALRWRRRRA